MAELGKKFDALMSAISFAEAGEFDEAKTLLKPNRRVLLALQNGRFDRKACTYALNTCKRLDSSLEILVVGDDENEGISPQLQPFLEQLRQESITSELARGTGCIKQAILRHTERENDILFVVIESEDALDRNCGMKDRKLSEAWKKLRCPLVVVADGLRT